MGGTGTVTSPGHVGRAVSPRGLLTVTREAPSEIQVGTSNLPSRTRKGLPALHLHCQPCSSSTKGKLLIFLFFYKRESQKRWSGGSHFFGKVQGLETCSEITFPRLKLTRSEQGMQPSWPVTKSHHHLRVMISNCH